MARQIRDQGSTKDIHGVACERRQRVFTLRVATDLYEAIHMAAARDGRSANQFLAVKLRELLQPYLDGTLGAEEGAKAGRQEETQEECKDAPAW